MKQELALVTGGARGIGRACCQALLSSGRTVAFFDVDTAGAEEFLALDPAARLHYIPCDLSDPAAIEVSCARLLAELGPVSILVNNAGVQTHCLFPQLTKELWDQALAVNLTAPFLLCKALAPAMVEQGYGRIINISSMSARRGSRKHVHYCASKAGLLGLTRALSLELADKGVTVNAICPGIVETDMIQQTLIHRREHWLEEMHVKRLGRPEDIANAVLFLAGRDSEWISGQAFDVNGGILTP